MQEPDTRLGREDRNMTGVVLIFLAASLAASPRGETPVERIAEALDAGAITAREAAVFYALSVFDSSSLPKELTEGTEAEPCGTPAFDAASALLPLLSESELAGVMPFLARPTLSGPESTYNTPGGHFKIHYTTSGEDATNTAWVYHIADGMDASWAGLVDGMDWDAPPSDLGLGGDNRYDVYIMALNPGTMGYCSSSGEPPDPSTPEADYASHIAISNNESYGSDQMLETCSHEFMHAVQAGYEAAEPSWFKENCSVWVQNEIWTTNHYADYLHTGENCLYRPWFDIRSGAMYHYGASPWPMYMEVRCGGQEVVREVWENCAAVVGANMLDAIETTAENHGMTFLEWLAEYTCWRWFTGNRADDEHYEYEESSLWTPGAYIFSYHNVNTLPWSGDEGVYPPDTYGNHWIRVNVTSYQGWITAAFDGRDNMDFHFGVILTAPDGDDQFGYYTVTDPSATLTIGVNTTGWEYAVFFVQSITDTSLDQLYDLSVTYQTGVEGGGQPGFTAPSMEISSNPFTSGEILLEMPQGGFTTISLYDLSGRLVDTVFAGNLEQGGNIVSWDASSLDSGAYFLRLTAPGGGSTKRIVVQHP